MHSIQTNENKNRLYITIEEIEHIDEIAKIVDQIKVKCKYLRPGFTCVTDLRRYRKLLDDQYLDYVKEAQSAMIAAGLSKVVRVVSQVNRLGHFQFDSSSVKIGYHARSVTSMEEADLFLDEFENKKTEPMVWN